MRGIFRKIRILSEHPIKTGILAVVIAFMSLLIQGTLLDLWDLKQEKSRLENRYRETLAYNQELARKIDQAQNSDKFIARQARERLDMVKEDKLVFIFENSP